MRPHKASYGNDVKYEERTTASHPDTEKSLPTSSCGWDFFIIFGAGDSELKTLVSQAGKNSLLVLEDLSGVRRKTEKVRLRDRYVAVSWAFRQLRQMIEYKAALHGSKVIAVDPAHTSQKCPKCKRSNKANRIKKIHTFRCQACGYTCNDDRIAAMNLRCKGIEYLSK